MTKYELEKKIKNLQRRLCCCPNNCPLSERTYYGDVMLITDLVQLQIDLNGNIIYSTGGITLADAIIAVNTALSGLATFTYDGEKLKMVANICTQFGLVAIIDNS